MTSPIIPGPYANGTRQDPTVEAPQSAASAWFGRSVMNMCPGLCVIMNGGFEASATACGVTPQAQNIGTLPGRMPTKSPQSGFVTSAMPTDAGSPTCTGAPWALGKRAEAVTAFAIM